MKLYKWLLSFVFLIGIALACGSYHTASAKDKVGSAKYEYVVSADHDSITVAGLDVIGYQPMYFPPQAIFIEPNQTATLEIKGAKPVKLYDLVSNPRYSKRIRCTHAHRC